MFVCLRVDVGRRGARGAGKCAASEQKDAQHPPPPTSRHHDINTIIRQTRTITAGQNIANWRIIKVWYNGNFFDSAEALAAEWAKPSSPLRRLKMKYPSERAAAAPFLRGGDGPGWRPLGEGERGEGCGCCWASTSGRAERRRCLVAVGARAARAPCAST